MATDYFVDPVNGSNAGTGAIGDPFQTIVHAATVALGFSGDRIMLRKGLYQEPDLETAMLTVPLIAYDEDVTLDGQGTQQRIFSSVDPFDSGALALYGIKFANYTKAAFNFTSGSNYIVEQCFFKAAQKAGSAAIQSGNGWSLAAQIRRCTFVGHGKVFEGLAAFTAGSIKNCIIHDNDSDGTDNNSDPLDLNDFGTITYTAFDGATTLTNIDSSVTSPGFVSPGGGNYALAANSALRGAGEKGASMGATFQPAIRVGAESPLGRTFVDPEWENDPLWWDPSLNGGLGGAGVDAVSAGATPGPALFQGGKWQIDTGYEPGATSARIRSKVYQLAETVTVRNVGWSADEDTALASGSKQVIDNTLANSTRHIEIRGAVTSFLKGDASPSWQTAAKSTSLSLQATYLQARMLMTNVGV